MSSEVKDFISKSDVCPQFAPKQPKELLISHDLPITANDPLYYENKGYLVTVDSTKNRHIRA